jgi:hypothetical protein
LLKFQFHVTNLKCDYFKIENYEDLYIFEANIKENFPSISCSNSMIGAVSVLELIKLFSNENCRQYHIYSFGITSLELDKPNESCHICSNSIISIECDFEKTTFQQAIKRINASLGFNVPHILSIERNLIYEEDDKEISENIIDQTLNSIFNDNLVILFGSKRTIILKNKK